MKLSESCADPRRLVSRASVLLIEMIAGHRQQANNVWQGSMYKCIGVETGTSHVYTAHYWLQQPWINICMFCIFSASDPHTVAPTLPMICEVLVVFGMYMPRDRFRSIWLRYNSAWYICSYTVREWKSYEVNVWAGSNILVGGNSITVYTFLPDFSNVVQYKVCVLSTTKPHTFLKCPVLAARELFRGVLITSSCIFFRRIP